jgi:hypothetical protein
MQGLPIVAARRRSRWQPTSPDWGSHPAAQRATSAPVQSAGSTLPEGLQPRRHTLEQERPSDDGRRHRHTSQMCTGSTTNMSSASTCAAVERTARVTEAVQVTVGLVTVSVVRAVVAAVAERVAI